MTSLFWLSGTSQPFSCIFNLVLEEVYLIRLFLVHYLGSERENGRQMSRLSGGGNVSSE